MENESVLLATASIGVGWASELLRIWSKSHPEKEISLPEEFKTFVAYYKEKTTVNLSAFQEVWRTGTIDCGMDLTDGILEFAYEIHDRTGLGVIIDPPKIHPFVSYMANSLSITPLDIMLDPGFDTPLSHGWCIRKENLKTVTDILNRHQVPFTIMGEVTDCVTAVARKTSTGYQELPRFWDDKCREEYALQEWERSILGRKLVFPSEE